MPEWTPKQRQAIDSRRQNLLVSAAAGSGKTAVMVERVKSLIIDDRIPLNRILVVTFTNAAAAQMRTRIIDALEAALEQGGDADGFLRAQLHGIDDAWISTMHAFCGRLLRRYYSAAAVDPGFRVMEEDEAAILRISAMDETLATAFEAMPPGFEALADAWGGRDGMALAQQTQSLYFFAQSRVEGLHWIEKALQDLDIAEEDFICSVWMDELLSDAGDKLAAALAFVDEARALCSRKAGPASYAAALAGDRQALELLMQALSDGYSPFITALDAFGFGPIGRKGKNDDPDVADAIKTLRGRAKDMVDSLRGSPLTAPLSRQREGLTRMVPVLGALYGLTADFAARYADEKAARSGLDFNDLEQYALRVVDDEVVRRELQDHFEAVFIDEYQDTNPVQERIITAVSQGDNLFCVGDVKQSIYRFRQAEPALFERRYNNSCPGAASPQRRIDMNSNFRSHPGILAGINYVFSQIMTPQMGGVTYDENAALMPGIARPEAQSQTVFELSILTDGDIEEQEPTQHADDADDEVADRAVWEHEALYAARRILEIKSQPIWDGKEGRMRPARWRDFVILMRTVSGRAHEVAAVLESQGIPVFADASAGFFDRIEVSWLMSALQLIDNRWRDIPMIAALRSPMAGLSLSELLAIRTANRDAASFVEAVYRYGQNSQDPLSQKINEFLTLLDAWKAASRHLRVDELMGRVLYDTGLYDIVGAMPDGDLRQGNLRILTDRARNLSDTPARGLYGFLRHIDHLREHSMDPGEARPLSERDDVVRVMSVHKSKGLEFPVVLVLGMGHAINMADTRTPLLLHGELGLGPMDYDMDQKIRRDTLMRAAIACRLRRETLSEGMRVLYVAMTRARERLIMVGSVTGDLNKKLAQWSLPLSPSVLAQGGQTSPLDWAAAAALRHGSAPLHHHLFIRPDPAPGGPVRWPVTLIDKSGQDENALPEISADWWRTVEQALCCPPDPAIAAAFAWTYPHAAAGRLPAKTSATALVEQAVPGATPLPEEQPRPLFMETMPAVDPALRGTLVHTALQFITENKSQDEIRKVLLDLEQRGILPPDSAKQIPPEKISAFLTSPVGRRAAAAERVLREKPFVVSVPACELYPGQAPGIREPVLVQGIIDLAFIEDGEWVLVDYKTNRVDGRQTPEWLLDHYRPQLSVYRRALSAITGLPVKAAGLYLIAADRMVWLDEEK